ncbi:acetyltransferase [Phyllobacterium sp. YR531]|nr:acetyltransferase [Phyllobacterium sp. YR531]
MWPLFYRGVESGAIKVITRKIASSDIDLICRHREMMFSEAGRNPDDLLAMAGPFKDWLGPRLDNGTYFGFVIEDEGRAVAAVGLMEIDWPPHPLHPTEPRRGYVFNVYVEPGYRRRGIAQQLMQAAEQEFTARGIGYLILHATTAGRPIYERNGWVATSEMAKVLSIKS